MTIHQIRCIESPFSSSKSELLVFEAVVEQGAAESELVGAETDVDVGIGGKRDVDDVAEAVGIGGALEEARDAELLQTVGDTAGKKLFCRLTSLVMEAVALPARPGSSDGRGDMSLSCVGAGSMLLVVLVAFELVLCRMLLAMPLANAVGAASLGLLLVLAFKAAMDVELDEAGAATVVEEPKLVGKLFTGPAANLELSTTATPIEPNAERSSSGTSNRFALREMLISAGVGIVA